MRFVSAMVLVCLPAASNAEAPANEAAKAVSEFKVIVAKHQQFFDKSPKVLTAFPEYYSVGQYRLVEIRYDVKKTDSLVSPFKAHIEVVVTVTSPNTTGDVRVGEYPPLGWKNLSDAKVAMANDTAFKPAVKGPISLWFTFAYQESKWVLKTVDRAKRGNSEKAIAAVLGLQPARVPGPRGEGEIATNANWRELALD